MCLEGKKNLVYLGNGVTFAARKTTKGLFFRQVQKFIDILF